MPVAPLLPLAPFVSFRVSDFHVGGDVSQVLDTGAKWVVFGQRALEASVALRSINDGGFLGTEGDKYRELVNASMPSHLDVTGDAHLAVGEAIKKYGVALSDATTQMGALVLKATGDHAAVQAAVVRYNTAEAVLAAATIKATAGEDCCGGYRGDTGGAGVCGDCCCGRNRIGCCEGGRNRSNGALSGDARDLE